MEQWLVEPIVVVKLVFMAPKVAQQKQKKGRINGSPDAQEERQQTAMRLKKLVAAMGVLDSDDPTRNPINGAHKHEATFTLTTVGSICEDCCGVSGQDEQGVRSASQAAETSFSSRCRGLAQAESELHEAKSAAATTCTVVASVVSGLSNAEHVTEWGHDQSMKRSLDSVSQALMEAVNVTLESIGTSSSTVMDDAEIRACHRMGKNSVEERDRQRDRGDTHSSMHRFPRSDHFRWCFVISHTQLAPVQARSTGKVWGTTLRMFGWPGPASFSTKPQPQALVVLARRRLTH